MGMDRNQRAKQKFAEAQQRRTFIQQVASGETGAYDKDRKRLEAGHLVFWEPPPFLYWLVEDVGPALDQAGPAMRVKLTITVPLIVRPGEPIMNMVLRGQQKKLPAEEAMDGAAKNPTDGADAPEPSD